MGLQGVSLFYEGQDKAEINKKKNDLLHDIICMANNLSNHEAYLIMGISDNPVEIIGVEKYLGRWTQENYLDFIHSKKWAGDYIPALELRTITNEVGAELDILVVHKSQRVPFILKKNIKVYNLIKFMFEKVRKILRSINKLKFRISKNYGNLDLA